MGRVPLHREKGKRRANLKNKGPDQPGSIDPTTPRSPASHLQPSRATEENFRSLFSEEQAVGLFFWRGSFVYLNPGASLGGKKRAYFLPFPRAHKSRLVTVLLQAPLHHPH